ncbi:MAG: DEAD/DEAH box helicase [Nitriliruptorales bacterium]|nr:DEAD/DEAH box helicase [Nitriliruptorales bacterium]
MTDQGQHSVSARHAHLTFVPGELAPASGAFVVWGVDHPDEAALELGFPAGEKGRLRTVVRGDDGRLERRDVDGRVIPLVPILRVLAAMPPGSDHAPWQRPSDSVLAWSVAAKLALEFVSAGRVVPSFQADQGGDEGRAIWRCVPTSDGRLAHLAEAMPLAATALRSDEDDATVWVPLRLLRSFCDAVADACGRAGRRPEVDPRRRGARRPWEEMWADALASADPTVSRLRMDSGELADAVQDWASPYLGRREGRSVQLLLKLEPPATEDGSVAPLEVPSGEWRLSFHLRSILDESAVVPAGDVWGADGVVELAGKRVHDAAEVLVRALAGAARLFPPLEPVLSDASPTGIDLSGPEVAQLLTGDLDALVDAGIAVQIPPELRQADDRRLRIRARIGRTTDADIGSLADAGFSLPDLTQFEYELAIGDDALTEEEFAEIVKAKQPLVRWRGQWVRVERDEADRLAAIAGTTGTLDVTEALAAALAGQRRDDELGLVDTVASGEILALVERLVQEGADLDDPNLDGIDGDLRDYQRRGIAWLQQLAALGLGGVLADEMGLGKSVQAIALMTARRQDRPHLVVCPTSVVGNWEREIAKWTGDFPSIRYHGPDRPSTIRAFHPGHITVTTYALLRRDIDLLEAVDWDVVVFDEAQKIKNAESKGAKAARALDARVKIAMTGTPIENRLSELWAIIDVTNPGLLGSRRRFNERFGVPIERWHDAEAAERLRRLIAPFVMRRLKSDPEVSVDLPEKQEITVHCSLTREQASLYQAAVDKAFSGEGLGATTFERRGRILALLTALKQICNHPRQYLRDGSRLQGRSGKLSRVTDILQEVVASGDHALVFTQYKQMGDLLVEHLESALDLPEVPFLHGGTAMSAREAMVDRFQEAPDAPPILLVSLRAGGTGLNLTRATEVIHYDRWWNPAVEQQATDRAHRLGQTRPVTVHALVTAGTVEDRIAELLQQKKDLARQVVGEGEAWITELDDDDLRELIALNEEDVEDEEEAVA